MKQHKVTKTQLRRHNELAVLRAVYRGVASNRAAIANELNLTKPTISDIVEGLIQEGLLLEEGFGQSTESGGKRPRLLHFLPEARQVIGVSLTTDLISGVLTNLNGDILLSHHAPLTDKNLKEVFALLVQVINGIVAQLTAPLQCISVGIVAVVDEDTGMVRHAPSFGWRDVPLAQMLAQEYQTAVHVANSTALAALAQLIYADTPTENLATILINNSIGIGVAHAIDYATGNDIGQLVLLPATSTTPAQTVSQLLSWHNVKARAHRYAEGTATSLLHAPDLSYLHIQYAQSQGDRAAERLVDEISRHVAILCAWMITTHRAQCLTIGGAVANLGQVFLDCMVGYTRELTLPELVDGTYFALNLNTNLVTVGAVAQALQKELGLS